MMFLNSTGALTSPSTGPTFSSGGLFMMMPSPQAWVWVPSSAVYVYSRSETTEVCRTPLRT
jgi:hypothetical protein